MWVGAVARPSLSPVVCGDVVIYYESNNGVSKGDWIYVRLRLNGVKVLTVLGWTRKLKIKRHETMIRSSRLFPLINCSLNRSLYEVCSFISLFFGVFLLLFCLLLVPDFRTRILGDWACPVSNWCTFYSNSWGAVEYWPNDHQTMLLNFFTPHHSLLLYSAFFIILVSVGS